MQNHAEQQLNCVFELRADLSFPVWLYNRRGLYIEYIYRVTLSPEHCMWSAKAIPYTDPVWSGFLWVNDDPFMVRLTVSQLPRCEDSVTVLIVWKGYGKEEGILVIIASCEPIRDQSIHCCILYCVRSILLGVNFHVFYFKVTTSIVVERIFSYAYRL